MDARGGAGTSTEQRFGPYVIGETIGRGSFAKVKIGTHESTKMKVALKIIHKSGIEDKKHWNKVMREIRIMKVLHHPHITRLYDVVQTKHDIVLIMEYVSGGELFDYICNHGRLTETESRYFFQQLAAAVAYCHRCRVAHRDIKPENIMLMQSTRHIKLTDFGLSSIMHDGRLFETCCGTPNYAAPEVVTGGLYSGPEADAWSCGVVLFAMLTGSLPFDDGNVQELFLKIKAAEVVIPTYLSPDAQDLLRRILVANPLERATMEQVLQHPWVRATLPSYILSIHYHTVLQTSVFARLVTEVDEVFDDEVVAVVAARFRIPVEQTRAILMDAEEDTSMMQMLERRMPAGDEGIPPGLTYPGAVYWRTFGNILDAKLWPTPLHIPAAEVALRDEKHDVVVSYDILSQRKHHKLGPEELTNKSFGENASNLLMTKSMKGYGAVNANSLQMSANTSFAAAPMLLHREINGFGVSRGAAADTFNSLPEHLPADTPREDSDPWDAGYNQVSMPFISLSGPQSIHTLLGSIFRVAECSRRPAPPVPPPPPPLPVICSSPPAVPRKPAMGGSVPKTPSFRGSNSQHLQASQFLHPLGATPEELGLQQQQQRLLFPMMAATSTSTPGTQTPQLFGRSLASSHNNNPTLHTPDPTGAYDDFLTQGAGVKIEASSRFGNDYMRNGVVFRLGSAQATMRHVYRVLVEEGFLWKPIRDFFLSCVRYPDVKLQIMLFRLHDDGHLVDVTLSAQSGMGGMDAAMAVMERLRRRATGPKAVLPLLVPHKFRDPATLSSSPAVSSSQPSESRDDSAYRSHYSSKAPPQFGSPTPRTK